MFGWISDFYKRHRKKILFTGVLAGGTYVLSKYVSWKFEEWQEAKLLEYAQEAKKQYHFESNQRTCTMTFMSFLPNIRTAIVEQINTDELLDQLKRKPDNKLEIWEQLKILSMSRLLCSVVANVTLLVFLKVELNIIGGYMFKNSLQQDDEQQSSEMNNIQVKYLNNVRYFIEVQLPILIKYCIEAVTESIASISLKEKISFGKLNEIMKEVKLLLISKSHKEGDIKHAFCMYMVDPEWESIDKNDMYGKMTSETVNVLESADCAKVIDKCFEVGFDQVLDHMKTSFHGHEEDPEAIVSLENCIQRDFYKPIDLPLAKIVPLLNGQIHEIFKAGANEFLDVVFSESILREFSNNIYDAFSKEYS